MIQLKTLIVENDLKLVNTHRKKDPYTVQAVTGLKVLGVDPALVRYKLVFGKSPTAKSHDTTMTVFKSFDKTKSRGAAGGTIWKWDSKILWEIFEQARDNYKELVKKYHPDRIGGDGEKMMLINRAWEVVKKTFKKNGYELPE